MTTEKGPWKTGCNPLSWWKFYRCRESTLNVPNMKEWLNAPSQALSGRVSESSRVHQRCSSTFFLPSELSLLRANVWAWGWQTALWIPEFLGHFWSPRDRNITEVLTLKVKCSFLLLFLQCGGVERQRSFSFLYVLARWGTKKAWMCSFYHSTNSLSLKRFSISMPV